MSAHEWIDKDFYKVLGVAKDADAAAIKKAYRSLARQNHPDANKGDAKAEERFKEISEAYSVLSDPQKRKEYDEARALFAGGGFRPGGFGGTAGAPGGAGGFTFDLNDLLRNGRTGGGTAGAGAGGLGDLFGGLFGRRGGAGAAAARKGADLETELTIAFREAVEGTTVPVRLTVTEPCQNCRGSGAKPGTMPRVCPSCAGTGHVNTNAGGFGFAEPCPDCRGAGEVVDDPCPVCAGTGRAARQRSLNVRIPAGVTDGQRLRLRGKGQPGERGGPAGDLNVLVHVTPDRVFGRSGDNLTVTVPVTFAEAALGASVPVPTLGGAPVTVKLPPGTPSGRTMRVKGKGARRKDGTNGDLLVTVEVAVPQQLSDEAREALQRFAEAAPHDPRADLMSGAGER